MTAHDWNPERYLSFGDQRLRPALDLMGRIGRSDFKTICDLGCGAGNVTQLLAQRWPAAMVRGVDSSPAMLHKAERSGNGDNPSWQLADLTHWAADQPIDLLYSNAALHWLADHDQLFARLRNMLAPGGVLAVQMPSNFAAPSHTAIADVVRQGPWRDRLEGLLKPAPVAPLSVYYDRLAPYCDALDLWQTTYAHILDDDQTGLHPVTQWTRTTALHPFLGALDAAEQTEFLAAHSAQMAAHYPHQADGRVMFPFTRIFMVAQVP